MYVFICEYVGVRSSAREYVAKRDRDEHPVTTASWFEVRQIYAGLLNAARPLTPVLRILWLDTRL